MGKIRNKIKKIISAPARGLVKNYYKAEQDIIDEKRSIIKQNRKVKKAPSYDDRGQVTKEGKIKFMAQQIKEDAMKKAKKKKKKKRGVIYYKKK